MIAEPLSRVKTLHLAIIVITAIIFSGTDLAFAQEYVTVKPAFLKDHSDACSKLAEKITLSEFYNNLRSYIAVYNNTKTTTVYYNDTKLLTTFSPLSITGNLGYIYDGSFGPPPSIYKSDSKLLPAPALKKLNLEFNKTGHFTEALTNVGNKTVNVGHPYGYLLFEAVYFKNGTMLPFYSYLVNNLPYSYGIPEWPDFMKTVLEPGQSIIVNEDPIAFGFHTPLPPGNYTMKVFARIIGDMNGTCTTVFLWSQPVDLTVLQENYTPNETNSSMSKVAEFPFAIIVLIIATFSIVVISRMRHIF